MFPDFFNNDAFSQVTLTQQILSTPFKDGTIRSRLPWNIVNSPTAAIAIEKSSQGIGIISSAPRGAPGAEFGLAKKRGLQLIAPHYPFGAMINANEVKDALRMVGASGELVGIQQLHQRHMDAFVKGVSQVWEYCAQGALDGLIKDPDGSTVIDLGQQYGEVPQVREVDWTDPSCDWITELEEAKSAAIAELGGLPTVLDWVLLMIGPANRAIRSNKKLAETKDRIDPAWLAADRVRNSSMYRFSDNVELLPYQGTANMPIAIDHVAEEGCALLLPVVDGMYEVTFTPAEGFDTINAPGQEMYADVPREKITKSQYRLEGETNFVHTVKKPKGIIKFVMPH